MNNKTALGKFYTIKSPFQGEAWDLYSKQYLNENEIILEPFAGSNNIPKMLNQYLWQSYDILPEDDLIVKRDTLKDFPLGFKTCITNPPYLDIRVAKNKGIEYHSSYSDLYLESLDKVLNNCENVITIIPNSFMTQTKFKERLLFWDKIDDKIFADTDFAVGVAYFIGNKVKETQYFLNGQKVNNNSNYSDNYSKFHHDNSNFSVCLVDNPNCNSIKIMEYDKKYHKSTNRCYVCFKDDRLNNDEIDEFNCFFEKWRSDTHDYWLSPFKSQFKNKNTFRKRLGFNQLSGLIGEFRRMKNENT